MAIKLSHGLIPKRDHLLHTKSIHGEEIGPTILPYFEVEDLPHWKFLFRSLLAGGATCPECGRPRIKWEGKWICPPLLTGECSGPIDYSPALAAMLQYEMERPERNRKVLLEMLLEKVIWMENELLALGAEVQDMNEAHQHQWHEESPRRFCLPVEPPYWRVRCECGATAYRRTGDERVIRVTEPKVRENG